jgi:hypothetical protein
VHSILITPVPVRLTLVFVPVYPCGCTAIVVVCQHPYAALTFCYSSLKQEAAKGGEWWKVEHCGSHVFS